MNTVVLMYHGVAEDGACLANLHSISERSFRDQLAYLAQSSHPVLPWTDIASGSQPGPGTDVGLTFDDANASDLACARRLYSMGYSALHFIPTAYLGTAGRLGQDDVRELVQLGMGVGSHGHRHVHLVHLSDAALRDELDRSKGLLEDVVGHRVQHISFPGGVYNRRVVDAARRAGYEYFHTSDWGVNTDVQRHRRILRRVAVFAGTSLAAFEDLLAMRNYAPKRLQFLVKELAKKSLGERAYLRARGALAGRRVTPP